MDDALDDWKLRGYCFIRQSESLPDLRSVMTRFFDMEQSAKLGFHEKADRYPTGYQDRIDEYDKELFIARRTGTLWPSEDFRDVALRSLEHLEAIAWEASGVRGGPGTSLTCIRYLARQQITHTPYHTDVGLVTVIEPSSIPGLSIWDPVVATWVQGQADNALTILAGETLQALGGPLAAVHQVRCNSPRLAIVLQVHAEEELRIGDSSAAEFVRRVSASRTSSNQQRS
jgi:hypothetical protein